MNALTDVFLHLPVRIQVFKLCSYFYENYSPPKQPNISHQKKLKWLFDYFPFEMVPF